MLKYSDNFQNKLDEEQEKNIKLEIENKQLKQENQTLKNQLKKLKNWELYKDYIKIVNLNEDMSMEILKLQKKYDLLRVLIDSLQYSKKGENTTSFDFNDEVITENKRYVKDDIKVITPVIEEKIEDKIIIQEKIENKKPYIDILEKYDILRAEILSLGYTFEEDTGKITENKKLENEIEWRINHIKKLEDSNIILQSKLDQLNRELSMYKEKEIEETSEKENKEIYGNELDYYVLGEYTENSDYDDVDNKNLENFNEK